MKINYLTGLSSFQKGTFFEVGQSRPNGFTYILLRLRTNLSNLDPLSAKTKTGRTIRFVPFPARQRLERHKNQGIL